MDLGGVYFRGDTCPLAPGSHVADVTLKLPPALPLGQLKLLGIDQSRSGAQIRYEFETCGNWEEGQASGET